MDKKRKELLEKIEQEVIPFAQEYLEEHDFNDYEIKDVFSYKKEIELVNKETKRKEKFKLYAVQTLNSNPEKGKDAAFELELFEDEKGNMLSIEELMLTHNKEDLEKNINDVVGEETKEDEKNKKETYKELKEERDKQEKETDKEEKKDEKEDEKVKDLKINNAKGEVDLDQQVNGETLRKIIGLSQDYISIVPVRASTVGVKGSSEYCYVAKKADNTVTVLGADVLKEDRQEGTNPYDKDTQINSDGSISEKSSISGFRVANRPNFFISVGYDENSSTRKSIITDVSGREGRNEEIGHELEKEGDGWQDPDARNILRKEDGIDKAKEIKERQEAHKKAGCKNDRVENIDDEVSNDIHEHLEINWKELATKWGYYKDGKPDEEKAKEVFGKYKYNNPHLSDEKIIQEVSDDLYEQIPGKNNNR